MKSILFLVAFSLCATFCVFAEETTQPETKVEEEAQELVCGCGKKHLLANAEETTETSVEAEIQVEEAQACKCGKSGCGGKHLLACEDCIECGCKDKDQEIADCGCKGRGKGKEHLLAGCPCKKPKPAAPSCLACHCEKESETEEAAA